MFFSTSIHFFGVVDGEWNKLRLETTGFKASVVRGLISYFLFHWKFDLV